MEEKMNDARKVTLDLKGRCGHLIYKDGRKTAKAYIEMSGVPEYQILLSMENLEEWQEPKGQLITKDDEDQILQAILAWEKESGMKTDIPAWVRTRMK